MIAAKTFVDSNVLIYGMDAQAGARHESAKRALEELWSEKSGVLSMQVLQEFYYVTTRKIATPLPREIARRVVKRYALWCIPTGPAELDAAFAIEDAARISFWDALIVAAAVKAGAKRILTEDLHHGQTIAGVRIENPFAD
ncbi:MAG: PIN domain-containing protein [Acidobacteriota bacterium]